MEELKNYIQSLTYSIVLKTIKLSAHIRAITNIKFNKSGDLLVTTAKDTTPMLWDTTTGQRLGTYEGHEGSIWSCDINSDSTLLITGSSDQTLKIWKLSTGEIIKDIEHEAGVRSVCFGNDNQICVVTDTTFGETPKIMVYDISDINKIDMVLTYETPIKINTAIFNNNNNKIYFCSIDGSVSILDIPTNTIILKKYIHKGYNCRSIRFDKNFGMVITSSNDYTTCLLDSRNLDIIKTYSINFPINDSLILNELVIIAGGLDAQSVTTSDGNKFDIKFYSKIFEELLGSFSNHFGPVNSIDCTEDGKIFASAGEDGFGYIYHLQKK